MTAEPRPSASICLLTGGDDTCRVLMAQRGEGARFMGGAWVFPGGVVDDTDRGASAAGALTGASDLEDTPWRAAALRELVEEAGVWLSAAPRVVPAADRPHGREIYEQAARDDHSRLAAGDLAWFSTWVTPTLVPVRFDARFYVALIDEPIDAIPDGREIDRTGWIDPAEAAGEATAGSFLLPFPTRRTLERFAELGSARAVYDHARSQAEVPRIQPRLRIAEAGTIEALVPGEPGFDELEDLPPDPDALARAARVTSARGEPIPELGRR